MIGFNWIWNSEEGFRLLFVCLFYLLCFVWKALGQRGSVDYGFGPVASLVFGAGGLGHVAGGLRPPLASAAPTSVACPHWPRLPPWRGGGLGTGTRHWAPALAVGIGFSFSLSFIYKSIVFPSFWIDRQFIIFSSSPSSSHLLVATGIGPIPVQKFLGLDLD